MTRTGSGGNDEQLLNGKKLHLMPQHQRGERTRQILPLQTANPREIHGLRIQGKEDREAAKTKRKRAASCAAEGPDGVIELK